jgi:pimeloyl-ACP methyl ester carboxylesterase
MDYALLADAVYDDSPSVSGWRRTAFQPSGSGLTDAFQGAAFSRGAEVVFALKGTSGGRDVVADIKLATGMNTYQYTSAREFVLRYQGLNAGSISLCGHSLGGAIAQIIGNRQNLSFVTFNAPGVGLFSRNLGETAATLATGSAALRTAGTIASAIMHPVQAARDAAAVFTVVRGANFRLGSDLVGSTGVHYGRVIEIPYGGGAMDVLAKHKMASMIEALETSNYRDQPLVAVV